MESSVIDVDRQDGVVQLWLDRPDKLNAMGPAFWEDLPAFVEELGRDPSVRVIVIAGRGRAFSVGIDLAAFASGDGLADFAPDAPAEAPSSDVTRRHALYGQIKRMQHTFTAVEECPVPVIAAVHGYCLGGGVDLVTACDIRLAAADAVFSVRETRLAMVADVGTLQRLPRILDPGAVAELVYTGRDVTAEEAHRMGLVSRVYPDTEGLIAGAVDLARQIAANSPLAVRGTKAVLRSAQRRDVAEQLDYVALWNAAFLHSNDLGEAFRAMTEGTPPSFTGT